MKRFFAPVGPLYEERAASFVGVTPPGATGAARPAFPAVVLMEPDEDGGATLLRLTADGEFAGDTWHMDEDDARHQADSEFGGALGAWAEIPADVQDAQAFVLARLGT